MNKIAANYMQMNKRIIKKQDLKAVLSGKKEGGGDEGIFFPIMQRR